ncbi:MAG TPA: hypothetical protein VD993_06565 [Chitinophagaceae bacterium]|nr:hypothetical protein [Chitinophagaceae bacterium]
MSNNITPDILIQYLDNELPPDERLYVEAQVLADAGLQQQLERLRMARQAFEHYAIKEKVSNIHQQFMQERRQAPKPGTKVYWLRTTLRVAAIVLVLLVVAGVVQYSLLDNDRLYSSHYEQFTLGTARSDSDASALQQAYQRGNMPGVIGLYEQRSATQRADHFLAGQAYLATGNAVKAAAAFDAQLTANDTLSLKPYHDDAEYYLALAYLKAGLTDKALPIFEKINRQPSHTYNSEVSGWFLTQLRWLKAKQSR